MTTLFRRIGIGALITTVIGFFAAMYQDSIHTEAKYWISRFIQAEGWKLYDEAAHTLDLLDSGKQPKVPAAYAEVVDKLKRASDIGIAQSSLELGELLCIGRQGFVAPDKPQARFLIEKAAMTGHPRAKFVVNQSACTRNHLPSSSFNIQPQLKR